MARSGDRAVNLDIVSDLDDRASGRKYGLGSSGAVAVAVVRAVAAEIGLSLSNLDVFKLAFLATTEAGAAGSGGDIACSSHGGVVFYRRPAPGAMEALVALAASDPASALSSEWPNLRIESLPGLPGMKLLVGWTGAPVKTDSQLAKAGPIDGVRTRGGERFVTAVASLSEKLWAALEEKDADAAMECLRENRRLLREYEAQRGVVIETGLLRSLADIADEHGAAGKSSGSGGGDCGIALVPEGADAAPILRRWATAGIRPLDAHIAVD
nr:phosphomevalonate kinase [Corynebacterium lactis]